MTFSKETGKLRRLDNSRVRAVVSRDKMRVQTKRHTKVSQALSDSPWSTLYVASSTEDHVCSPVELWRPKATRPEEVNLRVTSI